jgi:hypothetical protein
METTLKTNEAKIEKITNAALRVMADFATRATPGGKYTEADIVRAVITEPNGPVAFYLAGLIAKSTELVAVLDYAEAA